MYQIIKDMASEIISDLFEGGPGSGNWGHKGRPGKRGGSLPGGGKKFMVNQEIVSKMAANLQKRVDDSGLTKDQAMDYLKSYWKGRPEREYEAAINKVNFERKMKVKKEEPFVPVGAVIKTKGGGSKWVSFSGKLGGKIYSGGKWVHLKSK